MLHIISYNKLASALVLKYVQPPLSSLTLQHKLWTADGCWFKRRYLGCCANISLPFRDSNTFFSISYHFCLFSHETQQTYRAVLTGIREDPYCSGKIIIKVQQHRFIPTQQVHNNEHTFIHLIQTRGNQCSKKPCKCFKKL